MKTKEAAKHTPGPWMYRAEDFNDGCPKEHFISAPTRGRVCRLSSPDEEGLANARLIAAAPDLLAALAQLVECYDHPASKYSPGPSWEKARAAIAKAEVR